jgi:hypothetical protein
LRKSINACYTQDIDTKKTLMRPFSQIALALAVGFALGYATHHFHDAVGDKRGRIDASDSLQSSATGANLAATANSRITARTELGAPLPALAAGYAALKKPESALLQTFRAADTLISVLPLLEQRMSTDPEAMVLKARLLQECAVKTDPDELAFLAKMKEKAKEQNIDHKDRWSWAEGRIRQDDPRRQERLAAIAHARDSASSRCKGFEDLSTTNAEINALYEKAAERGNALAKAEQIACAIGKTTPKWEDGKTLSTPEEFRAVMPTITLDQVAALRAIVLSGEPAAATMALGILSSNFRNGTVRLGEHAFDAQEVGWFDRNRSLARVIGCDLGTACDQAFANDLRNDCIHRGFCGSVDYRAHVERFQLTPARAVTLDALRRQILDGIAQQDPTLFTWDSRVEKDMTNFTTSEHLFRCQPK